MTRESYHDFIVYLPRLEKLVLRNQTWLYLTDPSVAKLRIQHIHGRWTAKRFLYRVVSEYKIAFSKIRPFKLKWFRQWRDACVGLVRDVRAYYLGFSTFAQVQDVRRGYRHFEDGFRPQYSQDGRFEIVRWLMPRVVRSECVCMWQKRQNDRCYRHREVHTFSQLIILRILSSCNAQSTFLWRTY